MRCGKAREQISLDLDGQLPPDRAAGLTRHLDECADCLRYREDLLTGRRLLATSEPQLSENFEWRLQLKLNQTLAQAAAASLHPWQDRRADRAAWFRNFGAAAAVGMAAVLAVAMLAGPRPVATPVPVGEGASDLRVEAHGAGNGDRLDIDRLAGPSLTSTVGWTQRQVSGGQAPLLGPQPSWRERGPWQYQGVDELRAREQLLRENLQLRTQLRQFERQLRALQSPLDTVGTPVLDPQEEHGAPASAR